ncbi:MAG: hypothetical protein N2111_11840 [Candidatus Sumerlaeaceae bacterium]|nr:hypothetical protein [Candidatus Sumerlaeaceae bacterium]
MNTDTSQQTGTPSQKAERFVMGFIVVAATLCVGMIVTYLLMFDARGLM